MATMNPSHPAVAGRARLTDLRRTDAALRRHVLTVRQWALANGVPVAVDPLVVVMGTLLDDQRTSALDPAHWTEARVVEFMWTACLLWCLEQGIGAPPGVASALRAYWAFLAGNGGFAPGSDPLRSLTIALASCTAAPSPPRSGRRRPAPSGSDAG
jgi:hypothetical protein